MNVIRICKRIDSETLHLPELRPLIGSTVEIIVLGNAVVSPTEHDWQALFDAAGQDLIDPEVYKAYRDWDRQHYRPLEL